MISITSRVRFYFGRAPSVVRASQLRVGLFVPAFFIWRTKSPNKKELHYNPSRSFYNQTFSKPINGYKS
ncbi:MAG: hypothetical protein U1C58_07960 [Flavobacteriaceae bacterium]|nr:hypothetical protein [Flavobacteriaceae bacterium]